MYTDDTPIIVNPGDLEPELQTTLGAFLATHDFSEQEAAEMRLMLTLDLPYNGGGGATGAWTLRRAEPLNMDTVYTYLNDRAARPYERLRRCTDEPLPVAPVTREVYEHFLNVLPPGYLPGGIWYVPERVTDEVVNAFYGSERTGYFHRYINLRDWRA